MDLLDLSLRAGTIAILAILATLILISRIDLQSRLSVLAVAIVESAFLLTTSSLQLPMPAVMHANLVFLAALSPLALTWLIVTIFIDTPGQKWPWLLGAGAVSVGFYLHYIRPDLAPICVAIAVPYYIALVGLAIWSGRDDLVECRCAARPVFAAIIAGLALFITVSQLFDGGSLTNPEAIIAVAQSAAALAITFAVAIWFLRPDMAVWPGPEQPEPQPKHQIAGPDQDTALIQRISAAMAEGIWREEGLTIGALANHLSVPEHRLRRAINQGLGHRNFSSFINAARIEAAREVLGDPTQAATTVLEIAYSVGFASLGPFNRAFRAETGVSPTEYRKEMELRPADSENSAPIPANLH